MNHERLRGYSDYQMDLKPRICEFHQLYQNKDREHHEYIGPSFKCVGCEKFGCKECLEHVVYYSDQDKNIYICSPCHYRSQVRLRLNLKK